MYVLSEVFGELAESQMFVICVCVSISQEKENIVLWEIIHLLWESQKDGTTEKNQKNKNEEEKEQIA